MGSTDKLLEWGRDVEVLGVSGKTKHWAQQKIKKCMAETGASLSSAAEYVTGNIHNGKVLLLTGVLNKGWKGALKREKMEICVKKGRGVVSTSFFADSGKKGGVKGCLEIPFLSDNLKLAVIRAEGTPKQIKASVLLGRLAEAWCGEEPAVCFKWLVEALGAAKTKSLTVSGSTTSIDAPNRVRTGLEIKKEEGVLETCVRTHKAWASPEMKRLLELGLGKRWSRVEQGEKGAEKGNPDEITSGINGMFASLKYLEHRAYRLLAWTVPDSWLRLCLRAPSTANAKNPAVNGIPSRELHVYLDAKLEGDVHLQKKQTYVQEWKQKNDQVNPSVSFTPFTLTGLFSLRASVESFGSFLGIRSSIQNGSARNEPVIGLFYMPSKYLNFIDITWTHEMLRSSQSIFSKVLGAEITLSQAY